MNTLAETTVRLIASPRTWIDEEAVRQLYATARLDGVVQAVGLPDLHPGQGHPAGAAFLTEGVFHPAIVGADIGCGIGLWKSDLLRRQARVDRWSETLRDLEHPWEGDVAAWLQKHGLPSSEFDPALGTLGGGNHFVGSPGTELEFAL